MNLFIWDFHGTLEKGNEWAVQEVTNLALESYGYRERLQEDHAYQLYGRNWYEYFQYLLPNEPHQRHIQLQETAFRISINRPDIIARYVKPNDHAREVLESIASSNQDQIVISRTLPESLAVFLEVVQMKDYFPEGSALAVNAHARETERTKQDVLREFLNGRSYHKIVAIGDSPQDIQLTSVGGGVSYLYAHPVRTFPACSADYRIRDLREILREI
ncbi:TPA: HAD hydrolase-like protein [Candidatus Woesearchaeota archaeon]|nr:HAD hydrolase-like protein [Candidatus Woesearchaeota archaeon]HIH13541.1 HAD hydrolase-like protein [Candidatus Woesearchaeota archaeon]